jgi:hypothetical protein
MQALKDGQMPSNNHSENDTVSKTKFVNKITQHNNILALTNSILPPPWLMVVYMQRMDCMIDFLNETNDCQMFHCA